jgi:CMP-N,N'-diacetyllegionaminic acid synthase
VDGVRQLVIEDRSVLAVVTARGGSKGIAAKNVRVVAGKPLIAWTIEVAKASSSIDRLVLSSDDTMIIAVAEAYGCEVPFKRDASLSGDETHSIDVVLDALARCPGYDYVVLLQPTSPLRTATDIDNAVLACVCSGADSCVSVQRVKQHPGWMYRMSEAGLLDPICGEGGASRRQDLQPLVVLNGAVYVARVAWLNVARSFVGPETIGYEMPPDRSLDVDTEFDLVVAELLLSRV